jgi:branched-chain amino acid transport system substrate-binding protein
MKRVVACVCIVVGCGLLAGCGDEEETAIPAACATEGACAVFAAGQPIGIGLSGPLSGDYAMYGIDAQRGVEIAIDRAGALEGRVFRLNAREDEGSPEVATTVANLFAADPTVVAVVGPMFSGAAAAAQDVYEAARIPMVSPSATRIDLTQQGSTVFNRVVGSDLFQADAAANLPYDNLSARELAIIHDGSSYGQALAERVQTVFAGLGGAVVCFEGLTPGGDDYGSVLDTVAQESPDAIFFGGYLPEAIVLVNQRGASGLEDVPFVTDDGVQGADFITGAGTNADGVYATSPSTPPDSPAKDAFDAAYLAAYGAEAGSLTTSCWYGYDAANMIIAAIRDTAIERGGLLYIPRQALVARVRATSGLQGLTGQITCDANGECQPGGFSVFRVQGGAWAPVP